MKKTIKILLKSIYAGIMISIGGTIYLTLSNKIVGSLFFAIGLLVICMYNMNLYTGKIGYIINNKKEYLYELFLTLIGNFFGTFLTAFVINHSRINKIKETAINISKIKLDDSIISIFILSVFCGMLMYLAVNNYKKVEDTFGKYITIFLCVSIFILSGFEHCVANMFYFSVAGLWSIKAFLYLIIMVLGNSVGSVIISLYDKYIK